MGVVAPSRDHRAFSSGMGDDVVSKIGDLRTALMQLLSEHRRDDALPTSARFLFYELVVRAIISKEKKSKGRRPDQDMSDALTDLREAGDVPWHWIVDETRSLDDFTGYPTILAGVLEKLEYVRVDPWKGNAPLILCESRSLAGVLQNLCIQYGARIAATNGQCGGFLHTRIAPILLPGVRVLYLGDFDLAGNHIEQNTRNVLERIVGELLWKRLALTQEQVIAYDLPKIVKIDKRYNDGRGRHEAVETEALSQRVIVEIVRTRLEELLPEPLDRIQVREARQRNAIREKLDPEAT
jgi:hypothetical protein